MVPTPPSASSRYTSSSCGVMRPSSVAQPSHVAARTKRFFARIGPSKTSSNNKDAPLPARVPESAGPHAPAPAVGAVSTPANASARADAPSGECAPAPARAPANIPSPVSEPAAISASIPMSMPGPLPRRSPRAPLRRGLSFAWPSVAHAPRRRERKTGGKRERTGAGLSAPRPSPDYATRHSRASGRGTLPPSTRPRLHVPPSREAAVEFPRCIPAAKPRPDSRPALQP